MVRSVREPMVLRRAPSFFVRSLQRRLRASRPGSRPPAPTRSHGGPARSSAARLYFDQLVGARFDLALIRSPRARVYPLWPPAAATRAYAVIAPTTTASGQRARRTAAAGWTRTTAQRLPRRSRAPCDRVGSADRLGFSRLRSQRQSGRAGDRPDRDDRQVAHEAYPEQTPIGRAGRTALHASCNQPLARKKTPKPHHSRRCWTATAKVDYGWHRRCRARRARRARRRRPCARSRPRGSYRRRDGACRSPFLGREHRRGARRAGRARRRRCAAFGSDVSTSEVCSIGARNGATMCRWP